MDNIQVIQVTPDLPNFNILVSSVHAIAKKLALPEGTVGDVRAQWEQAGFLVAAYTEEKYRELGKKGRLYAALLPDGTPGAFSVIYRPEHPADEGDLGTKFTKEQYGDVPVVKQIATDPDHKGHGLARILNDHFADQYPDLPVFAAIVEGPRNYRSEGFHAKIGFAKVVAYAHPDGKPRGIWRRPPLTERRALPENGGTEPRNDLK